MEFKIYYLSPLLKECANALQATILPQNESNKMANIFDQIIPVTNWGKVDWEKIDKKIVVGYDHNDIIENLQKLFSEKVDTNVYMEWGSGGIPVIKSNLEAIVANYEDVFYVSFEKFFFNPEAGYIIEVLTSGLITVGVIEKFDVK